jgi:hypothetical protein
VANTLAYYDTATITAAKSFIVQAPGGQKLREEIDFEETAHFWPRAVHWRMGNLGLPPKNYL